MFVFLILCQIFRCESSRAVCSYIECERTAFGSFFIHLHWKAMSLTSIHCEFEPQKNIVVIIMSWVVVNSMGHKSLPAKCHLNNSSHILVITEIAYLTTRPKCPVCKTMVVFPAYLCRCVGQTAIYPCCNLSYDKVILFDNDYPCVQAEEPQPYVPAENNGVRMPMH